MLGLAARGDLDTLSNMLMDGYDHIVDIVGSDGTTILQVASSRGHWDLVRFLEGAREFEVRKYERFDTENVRFLFLPGKS